MGKLKKLIINPSIGSILYMLAIVFSLIFLILAIVIVSTFNEYSSAVESMLDMSHYDNNVSELVPVNDGMILSYYQYSKSGNDIQKDNFNRYYDRFIMKINAIKDLYPDFPVSVYMEYADNLVLLVDEAFNLPIGNADRIFPELEKRNIYFSDTLVAGTKNQIQSIIGKHTDFIDNALKIRIYIMMIIFAGIIAGLIIIIIFTNIVLRKRMKEFISRINKLSSDKDFNMDDAVDARFEELRKINYSVMEFVSVIKDIIMKLNASSSEIAAFSQQLAASSEEVSSATEEVSASTENITSDIMLLKDYTDNMNKTVEQMNALMDNTISFLERAKSVNEEFMVLMSSETKMINNSTDNFITMEKSIENIKLFIDDFIGQVKNIQSSVDSIKKVHKKIELLSLNAAIEAARAGKEGGGFAVIAEEIRSLSSRSSEASKDIEKIMDEVISNIRQLHNLINESLTGFKNIQEDWGKVSEISAKVSSESENTYNETNNLTDGIKKIESQFSELSNLFKEIKIRIDNVVASAEQISSSNEEITSQMEELTSSSQELSEKAQDIKGYVEHFKL